MYDRIITQKNLKNNIVKYKKKINFEEKYVREK